MLFWILYYFIYKKKRIWKISTSLAKDAFVTKGRKGHSKVYGKSLRRCAVVRPLVEDSSLHKTLERALLYTRARKKKCACWWVLYRIVYESLYTAIPNDDVLTSYLRMFENIYVYISRSCISITPHYTILLYYSPFISYFAQRLSSLETYTRNPTMAASLFPFDFVTWEEKKSILQKSLFYFF